MLKRTSIAVWRGNGLEGQGALDTQSGAFKSQPYSFKTRFQSEDGKAGTNPEELLGAAHAGCFAMATSFALSGAGHVPEELKVSAVVSMDKDGDGFKITGIHLDLEGKVPGIDAAKFGAIAEEAKKGCPISKALAATPITLSAKLLG
ncbi:MAG TPA: OsmC family protein [Polyangiaceae bacterium]|jgi:osmotically inducible protein OsmC|nr:OsmC family protein [Polyangiaceae bacterium]